jgi:peptidoglycan/LPS O-acetylase OafA/YrhL
LTTLAYSPVEPSATVPRSAKAGHLPSLDGLRALSIALVLLGHLSGTRGFVRLNLGIGDYAHLGVVVFFVISGFLITRLMLSEQAKDGVVSLKLFYARRALRLFPAAFAFIGCVSLLWMAGIVHLQARDIWHACTYTVNFEPARSWQIGHLWSLSVEEQFYFIWPLTFVLLGPRRAGWAGAAAVLLGPIARSGAWLFLRGTPYYNLEMFPMVADSIAMGCLLAMAGGWLEQKRWYLRLFRPAWSVGLLALVLLTNRLMGYTVVSVFGSSVINASLAVLIHRTVYLSRDSIGRVLNWKPIAFVGLLSYSLYLWQQLFLNRNSSAWINSFPQNLGFAVAAALGSYFLLEKPLLRLRQRLRGRHAELRHVSADCGNIPLTAQSDSDTTAKYADVGFGPRDVQDLKVSEFEVADLGKPIGLGDCALNK